MKRKMKSESLKSATRTPMIPGSAATSGTAMKTFSVLSDLLTMGSDITLLPPGK